MTEPSKDCREGGAQGVPEGTNNEAEPQCRPDEDQPATPTKPSSVLGPGDLLTPLSSAASDAFDKPTSADESTHQPSTTQSSPSFKGSKICVAIDVSASTYGDVLEAEKQATRSICSLIPRKLRPSIKIIPWNHICGTPVDLAEVGKLESEGGTDPNVFLNDSVSRDFLQDADFWFLMTDGAIFEENTRKFAQGIQEYGLHGKACIICIFGEREEKPAECNVTVGISVFAGSPHAAFLFHDVESGTTYVLQVKGCFSAILRPGEHAPSLDHDTSWEDLSQVSFENLSKVHIPPAEEIGKDEIILQDRSRFNMTAFLRDLPDDEKTVAQVLDNEENLHTIAETAKLRNEAARLRSWLDIVDAQYAEDAAQPGELPLPSVTHIGAVEQRSRLVADTLQRLATATDRGTTAPTERLSRAFSTATAIRHSSPPPPPSPPSSPSPPPQPSRVQDQVSGLVNRERRDSIVYMRSTSFTGLETAGDTLSRRGRDGRPSKSPPPTASHRERYDTSQNSSARNTLSGIQSAPGFNRPSKYGEQFRGMCNTCANKNTLLCLVIRTTPNNEMTDNFPARNSESKTMFAMAMGNYAETDILASKLLCDSCAHQCLRGRHQRSGDGIAIASLPLVGYSANKTAWLETIHLATNKRFHQSQLPQIFLGILYTKLERLVGDGHHSVSDLCEGIKWAANILLSDVLIQTTNVPHVDKLGAGVFHEVLLRSFSNTLSHASETVLLEYPMDGFVVMNAALSNSKHGAKISGSKRKSLVFLKYLYHITEMFYNFRESNDNVVTEAAKALVLLNDEPTGPSSLFRWDRIREISRVFKDAVELRKFFSQARSYKLSIPAYDLAQTAFFSKDDLQSFQRLGVLFNWIASQAAHATAIFVHHLFRLDVQGSSAHEVFEELRDIHEIMQVLKDPADVSAKGVDKMIERLPPL